MKLQLQRLLGKSFVLPVIALLVVLLAWQAQAAGDRAMREYSLGGVPIRVYRSLELMLFASAGAILGLEHLLGREPAPPAWQWRWDVARLAVCILVAYLLAATPLAAFGPAQRVYSWVLRHVLRSSSWPDSGAAVLFGYLVMTSRRRVPVKVNGSAPQE